MHFISFKKTGRWGFSCMLIETFNNTLYTTVYFWLQPSSSMHCSVRQSVRLSVTPFSLWSHRRVIMKSLGVITIGRCDFHATEEVKCQGHRGQNNCWPDLGVSVPATPVYIHRWVRNDAQSLKGFKEVPCCFSKSSVKFQGHTGQIKSTILTRIESFRAATPVAIHRWLRNDAQGWSCIEEVPRCFSMSSIIFQGHTSQKMTILTWIERFQSVTPLWIHRWPPNRALK